MGLQMTSSMENGATVVRVVGGGGPDDDVAHFREELGSHVGRGEGGVLIDLSGLVSWTSRFQAALLGVVHSLQRSGREVTVDGLAGEAAEQAHATGMDKTLPLVRRVIDLTERSRVGGA